VNKKHKIIKIATKLFAKQGFDGTTTLQIAKKLNITEPAIFYHFKNKDALFTYIVGAAFSDLFLRLNTLDENTDAEFKKIENYITLFFKFAAEKPDETYLMVSTCPAKLRDPQHICSKNVKQFFEWGIIYFSKCIRAGVNSDEFIDVPTEETASLLVAFINGIMRQKILSPAISGKNMGKTVIEFCRRSLVNT